MCNPFQFNYCKVIIKTLYKASHFKLLHEVLKMQEVLKMLMKGDVASYKHWLMKLTKTKNKKVLKMWTNCSSLACTSECAFVAQKHEKCKN